MIAAEVNFKGVTVGLDGFMVKAKSASQGGVFDAANEIMRLSQLEVPHDEGTLQNSGTVEDLPNGDIVVGYHTSYAARLHEHPEYHFQKGRKGKYLEDPILKNSNALGLEYGRGVQTRLF